MTLKRKIATILSLVIMYGLFSVFQPIAHAQTVTTSCSEAGFTITSGDGDGVTSLTNHIVKVKVKNPTLVKSYGEVRMEMFYQMPPGSNYTNSSFIDLSNAALNEEFTFIAPNSLGDEDATRFPNRYIHLYQKAWGGWNNSVICFVGTVPAQVQPDQPENPDPVPPQNPPTVQIPSQPPSTLNPEVCGWVVEDSNNTFLPYCKVGVNEYQRGNYTTCGEELGSTSCCGGLSCPPRENNQEPTIHICGEQWNPALEPNVTCNCPGSPSNIANATTNMACCGWVSGTACLASAPPSGGGGSGGNDGGGGGGGGFTGDDAEDQTIPPSIFDSGPTSETFRNLNPLNRGDAAIAARLSSPGGIIGRVLLFAFPLAGLILFAMIVWGGFEMLTGAASSKGMDAGKQRVTNAIIGFIILFSSYWIIQIVQTVFGIAIL